MGGGWHEPTSLDTIVNLLQMSTMAKDGCSEGHLAMRGLSELPKMRWKNRREQGRQHWQRCCINQKVDCSRKEQSISQKIRLRRGM